MICVHRLSVYIHTEVRTICLSKRHLHAFIDSCMYACIETYTDTYIHAHTRTHAYIDAFMTPYIDAQSRTSIQTCIHTYIHTYIHTHYIVMFAYAHMIRNIVLFIFAFNVLHIRPSSVI